MSRRVVLTCRSCKFILATRAQQAALFGWRFEEDVREAVCPSCAPAADGREAAQVAPPLGLVRQSTDVWHGELLRLPPARFLRVDGRQSVRLKPAARGPERGSAAVLPPPSPDHD